MIRLAQERQRIPGIVEENYPELGYWLVYVELYRACERSAQGIRKIISSRGPRHGGP